MSQMAMWCVHGHDVIAADSNGTVVIMSVGKSGLCSMFGAFNLRRGDDLVAFQTAYGAFCQHLKDAGFLVSWRIWKRSYHPGYDSEFPDIEVMIEMVFADRPAAEASWDYVEGGSNPMRRLHHRAYGMVKDSMFVLMDEVEG